MQIEDLKRELANYKPSQGEQSSTKSKVPLHRESLLSTYATNFENASKISPFSKRSQEKSPSLSLFDKTIDTSLFPPQDVSPLASPMTKVSYPNSMLDPSQSSRAVTKLESPMEAAEELFNQRNNSSDDAFGELHKEDLFQHKTFSSNLPATPEKENSNIDDLNGKFDKFLSISTNENKKEDSFNAFEASFQTTFPPSFSSSPPNETRSIISPEEAFEDADFGNSFFVNLQTSKEVDDVEKARRESNMSSPPKFDIDAPMDEARDLFSSSTVSKSQDDVKENQKVTARTSRNTRNRPQTNNSRNSPQRMAEAPSSRSQFDKPDALDAPMDEAQADESVHSPALVLKRLQQRKSKISPTASKDLTEEMRKLDAIANTVSPRNESSDTSNNKSNSRSTTRRRNVSQPVSYAEPSLNTKLRRGDVFFQKKDRSDDESPTSVDELKSLKERQVPNMNPLLEM